MKKLKLYVWEGVLTDYTSGIAFALAYSAKEARQLIIAQHGYATGQLIEDLKARPSVYAKPFGLSMYGGG